MLYSMWIWFLQCLGFDPRGIFSFHDGKRTRRCDPIVIARRLWSAKIEQQSLFAEMPGMTSPPVAFDSTLARKLIKSGIGEQMQRGYFEMAQAAQQAFDVKPLNEGGLTELECAHLVDRLENYLGDVKKNASGLPISPHATEFLDESLTSSDLDFGSISTDSNSEPPESSDSAPKSETIPL